MKQNSASRTAQYMALFRALETARTRRNRLFEDPLARSFLSLSLQAVVRLSRLPLAGSSVARLIDWRWPGARASGIARTRLIDDALAAALSAGTEQVVILGAGFDSRAYRIPGIEKARVFEVDHPATVAAKKAVLKRIRGLPVAHVRFVEMDFNRRSLDEVMARSGFDRQARTFFIWEGVTNYLTAEAVDSTLRYLATAGEAGSTILFTYIHSDVLRDPSLFEGARKSVAAVERAGERWTFGIDPARLCGYLAERGLALIEDVGSLEYRARYMRPSGPHMKGYGFYRIALAQIPPATSASVEADAVVSTSSA
jgi:methyltransferase (TIGR00027 family)